MAKTVYKENTYKNLKKRNSSWMSGIIDFVLKDQRFQFILGIFLVVSSFALAIAFFSYFFTGRADQSVVEAILSKSIQESGSEVQNWLGLTGAVLAHVLVFKWFGIASFALVPVIFLVGWRLAFKTELFPLSQSLILAGFVIFWLSLLFGALFQESTSIGFWAGGIGYFMANILFSLFGIFTLPFIVFALVVFLIYFFQIPPTISADNTVLTSIMTEFKNVQDKFAETSASMKEASKNRKTKITPPSKTKKTSPSPKDDFSKDIVLEINDDFGFDDEDEETRKTRAFKNPLGKPKKPTKAKKEGTKSKKDTKSPKKLDLEIDPSTPVLDLDNSSTASIEVEVDPSAFVSKEEGAKKPPNPEEGGLFNKTPSLFPEEELDKSKASASPELKKINPEEEILGRSEREVLGEDAPKVKVDKTPYDPTLELSRYVKPSIELLDEPPLTKRQVTNEELEANKDKIVETLSNYGIGISQIRATIGPTVTLYEIIPEAGVRISKIKNLEDDIALSLAALGIRIIAPIPGKGTIGIEVPNKKREMVMMRSVLESELFQDSDKVLPIILGKSVTNEVLVADLAKMPHLLMAGATGQGKSVGLNVFLTSLIYKKHPAELKFVLIDPKKVELTLFNKIERHFLAKLPEEEEAIVTDTNRVINTLESLCREMDNRYNLLKEAACRNIKEYNRKFTDRKLSPKKGHRFLPYIVLVIDELADLMMVAGKEVEQPIARLAQLARAIGIHLIVATQRPSVNVITGIIKANFPARLSFKVTSKVDSRTILDAGGAEQLVGMGDLLFSMGSDMLRLQCPFIDTPEVERICDYINIQPSFESAYELPEVETSEGGGLGGDQDFERDDLFEEAARIIVMHQQGSTSLLQRRLKLGYNRAGRLIDQLEKAGIVGSFEGSKAREVLVPDEYSLERLLSNMDK